MSKTLEHLEEIGFRKVGKWGINENNLDYTVNADSKGILKIANALYAFCSGESVLYIGKTTRSIEKCFTGYKNPGNSQATNQKCNENIRTLLGKNVDVEIYAFADIIPIQYAGYDINLAAGLEDTLILSFNPDWNGRFKKSVDDDISDLVEFLEDSSEEKIVNFTNGKRSFDIVLGETYFNTGFINLGIAVDKLVASHGEAINVYLGSMDSSVTSIITRNANQNGTARIHSRSSIRDWFQDNFQRGDTVRAYVLSPTEIFLFLK